MTNVTAADQMVPLVLAAVLSVTGAPDGPSTAHAAETEAISAPAIGNQPRLWRALTGDRLELDGEVMRLKGVRCPDASTDDGRAAKALLNTFLRGGYVTCRADGDAATCRKNGQEVADGMLASGYCEQRAEIQPRGPASGQDASRQFARDARHGPSFHPVRRAAPGPDRACRPAGLRAQALPLACLDRSPYSKCPGFPNRAVAQMPGLPTGRMEEPRRIVLPDDPAILSRLPHLPDCH